MRTSSPQYPCLKPVLAAGLLLLALCLCPIPTAQALGPHSNQPVPVGDLATAANPNATAQVPAAPAVAPTATNTSASQAPLHDRMERAPDEIEGVGVSEKLGAILPLDTRFFDEQGKPVLLGDLIKGDKPVILNLGYYGCPMLCGLVINGMVDTFKELAYTPGKEFRVITISIDPTEKHPLAMQKKRNVIAELGKAEAATGWHFLTGGEPEIKRITEAAGFGYNWDPVQRQYVHTAVMILLTPDGRISRYLYGIQYPAQTVRLSLVEASEGKIGSPMDQLLLYCFHFDPSTGNYSLAAMNLMRFGAVLSVMALSGFVGVSLWREKHAATVTKEL
ncbi:MAG: SCO family protein [Phycisphaerales bacterium]|nr:SCO family protein [Phycisphaerales bacterium]